MTVQILLGDVRRRALEIADESVDAIIADPPYGETSLAWDSWPCAWPWLLLRVLKRSGSMWVFGSQRMFLERAAEFSGWQLSQDIVWEKHNGSGSSNDRFRRVHEHALHFYRADVPWAEVYKAPRFTNDATAQKVRRKAKAGPAHWGDIGESSYRSEDGGPRLMRSVIYVRSEHGRAEHPTQKPIGIVEPLLLYACPIGGHVLDPFAGSGTVALAAKRHSINCTLIEISPEYVALAESRIRDDAPLLAEGAAE